MQRSTAEFADKHVVVTGGGRGIGAAVARAFHSAGARVTITGRDKARLDEAAAGYENMQGVTLDVSDTPRVPKAFDEAIRAFGAIDILVNNAGAAYSAPFTKTALEHLRHMLEVNLVGAFLCSQAALPTMSERPWGRIVNIASTAGLKGYAYVSAYSAAKHGLVGLTRSLALELARTNITVNAVCPGYTETELIESSIETISEKTGRSRSEARETLTRVNPQGRLIQPEEVAGAVRWLCRDDSGAITGQSIVVAGGEIMAG